LNRVDSTANMDVKKYTRSLIFSLIRRTTINEKRVNKTIPKDEMKFLLPSLSFSGARIVRKVGESRILILFDFGKEGVNPKTSFFNEIFRIFPYPP
jgi:hypothetical protein